MEEKLTEKQRRFVDYYIETGNATESAKMAGYRGDNLNNIGSENLAKLQPHINKRLNGKEDERIAKQDEVLRHLTSMMRGEIKEEVVIAKNTGDFKQEIVIVQKQVSAKERIKSAELLGKRYKLFTDKVEIEGNIGVVIIDDIKCDDDEPK